MYVMICTILHTVFITGKVHVRYQAFIQLIFCRQQKGKHRMGIAGDAQQILEFGEDD